MSKPLKRDMERALLVIEGMTYWLDEPDGRTDGQVPVGRDPVRYIKALQEFHSDCYKIAHAASGHCCSGGNGDPWKELIEERVKQLKKTGIVDVNKEMKSK